MLQFAIHSGLRQGEIWGLHWADVHLERDVPSIVVRHNRGSATKSGKPRELLLLPPAADALRRWQELITPKRLVFPAETGGVHHAGYDGGWKDRKQSSGTRPGYKSLAGITRHVRFHDLRHTCASHLVSGTWGRAWCLEEVRDYLDHSNISVTQRHAHMSPHAMRAAVQTTARPELQKRAETNAEQQREHAHATEAPPRHDATHADAAAVHAEAAAAHADAAAVHASFSARAHTAPPQIAAQALQLKAANLRHSQHQLGPALVPRAAPTATGRENHQ